MHLANGVGELRERWQEVAGTVPGVLTLRNGLICQSDEAACCATDEALRTRS